VSIAVKDVLERILTQVTAIPLPELGLEILVGAALRDPGRNASLGIARLTARGPDTFASNLHFWATGLRAFMQARGGDRDFAEVAERGLCTPIEGDELNRQVDRLLALAGERPSFEIAEPVIGAYEMFSDANRQSLLIETRSGFAALYWESDATLPASKPLLQLLWRHAEFELASEPGESWIVAQHDSDIFDPADTSYAWRVGRGIVESLEPASTAEAPRMRLVLENSSHRVGLAWSCATGAIALREYAIHGEGAEMTLVEPSQKG
jgi:hypothetical protein